MLGFLLKSELCQKCSKFRMQFCLRGSNNVLDVFSLKFASFLRYYVCEKHIFLRPSSGDLLLNEKEKKSFVSLNHGVSIIHESLTTASLAQVAKGLNGPDSSLFCPDASSIRGGGQSNFFFHSLSLHFSKPKISSYLRVFVTEPPFLIDWKGLGWICLSAGIVM